MRRFLWILPVFVVLGVGTKATARLAPPYLKAAIFSVSVDKWADIWINDVPVIESQPRTSEEKGPHIWSAILPTICLFKGENILAIEVDDNSRPLDPNQNYVGIAYVLRLFFSDGSQKVLSSNEAEQHRAYYIQDFMAGRPMGWQRLDFVDDSWGVAESTGNLIPGLATVEAFPGGGAVSFLSAWSSSSRAQRAGERHLFRRKFFLDISTNPDCLSPKAVSETRTRFWLQPTPTPRIFIKPTPTAAIARIEPLLVRQPDQRHREAQPTPTVVQIQDIGEKPTQVPKPTWTSTPMVPELVMAPPTEQMSPTFTSTQPFIVTPSFSGGQTIVFGAPPANIYVSFADGPGLYQLEAFDKNGNHWKTFFTKKVVAQGDDWAEWDGKNEAGREAPVGEYYVIFSRNGKELKRITVIKSVGNP